MRNCLFIAFTLAFMESFASESAFNISCSEGLIGVPCSEIPIGVPCSEIPIGTPCSEIPIGASCSEIILEYSASEKDACIGSGDGGEAENYVRFAPYALIASMKLAGIESRSSNSEFLASFAMSNIFMAGTVETLKKSIKESRPDKSSNNAFPSGHTAIAFTAASILHKEFGETTSPWISFGAYGIATATGVLRATHSRHWAGDILAGAGIGVLSTELGYYLSGLFFHKKKSHRKVFIPKKNSEKPSFVEVQMGGGLHSSQLTLSNSQGEKRVELCTSTVGGVEGALFLNSYIGIGGMCRFSVTPVKDLSEGIVSNQQNTSLDAGIYSFLPISEKWSIGGKALIGTWLNGKSSLDIVFGANIGWRYSRRYMLKVFADFDTSKREYSFLEEQSQKTFSALKRMNTITVGSSFAIMF